MLELSLDQEVRALKEATHQMVQAFNSDDVILTIAVQAAEGVRMMVSSEQFKAECPERHAAFVTLLAHMDECVERVKRSPR